MRESIEHHNHQSRDIERTITSLSYMKRSCKIRRRLQRWWTCNRLKLRTCASGPSEKWRLTLCASVRRPWMSQKRCASISQGLGLSTNVSTPESCSFCRLWIMLSLSYGPSLMQQKQPWIFMFAGISCEQAELLWRSSLPMRVSP